VFTLFLFIASTAAYVPYAYSEHFSPHGPRGGSIPGLAYGIVGTILMIYAGVLGVRRKMRSLNLGRATTWLKGHIWLGLLSYPLIFFHAGFRIGGTLTIALLVLFTIVLVSGIYGLVVQQIVPRLMTVQVTVETMYEQVGTYVQRIREDAAKMVTDVCGVLPGGEKAAEKEKEKNPKAKKIEPVEGSEPLKQFYTEELESFLDRGRGRLGNVGSRSAVFSHYKVLLPPSIHTTLTQLEDLCEERRQLAMQIRLHHWLHGWLIVHIPAAAALLVLTVVHAVASVYY
jgi:hypothetical protein